MNDEQLPISAELASAYLDGELDAAERATAVADADVMAMVDSFTQVRALLGDVAPVVDSTRTAAMAGALAEFDTVRSPQHGAVGTATVTPLNSRRVRAYRVLTGVAAAAVVGVVAVAAFNSTGSDNKSSSAVEATEAPAEGLPKVAADAAGAPPADNAAGSDTSARSGANPSLEAATTPLPEIDTAAALKEYAAAVENLTFAAAGTQTDSTTAPGAATQAAPAAANPTCLTSDQSVIGTIMFQSTLAYAVRDVSTGVLRAVDSTDCHVLIEVGAP
ncbi:MAG: hypothetical protein ABI894_15105 [Ilumatobacteraceae bacterium]